MVRTTPIPLPLLAGDGWRIVQPRETGWGLAWECRGSLYAAETGFREARLLGKVGPVESAVAYCRETGRIFRYACSQPHERPFFNEIRGSDPRGGLTETAFRLPANRWIPWLFDIPPEGRLAVALLATEFPPRPATALKIEHQIGLYDLVSRRSRVFHLPAGCLSPEGLSHASRRIVFSGPGLIQCVSFGGRRQWWLRIPTEEMVRGASFRPGGTEVAIGGSPLAVFDETTRERREVAREGLFPAWAPDGSVLFYRQSSGDLQAWDPVTGESATVFRLAVNRHPEWRRAVAPVFSGDGRYLACNITRREPRTSGADPRLSAWSEQQALVVVDREQREIWQYPTPVASLCWWR